MRLGPGSATFLAGALAGVLLAILVQELWPADDHGDLAQYAAVRDFARETYVREVSDEELLDLALHGMLRGLDDYSRFFDREEAETLSRETTGRYRGVGVVFRRPVNEGRVLYPLPGSPGERGGLRVGDRLLSIDGRAVAGLDEPTFRALLRGPEDGGPIQVRVLGLDEQERELRLVPGSVVDPSVRHARLVDAEAGIGYLSIVSFSGETHEEFDRAWDFLAGRGARALVLDLRHNLGGVLDGAVRIAQRFVTEGSIVSTEGRGEPVVYRADVERAGLAGLPLVVLVDRETASASEVLAGALQDHRLAALVGEPTYGKGMVQTIRRFRRWSTRAKVTSSYYYSPARRNFERTALPQRDHGLWPDVEVLVAPEARQALYAFLDGYGPSPDAIPALEAWQDQTGERMIEPHPADAALEVALDLLRGRRPGPYPLE